MEVLNVSQYVLSNPSHEVRTPPPGRRCNSVDPRLGPQIWLFNVKSPYRMYFSFSHEDWGAEVQSSLHLIYSPESPNEYRLSVMDVSSINPQYSMVHLRIWIDTKLDLSDLLFHPKYTYLETRIMQLV